MLAGWHSHRRPKHSSVEGNAGDQIIAEDNPSTTAQRVTPRDKKLVGSAYKDVAPSTASAMCIVG